MWWCNNWLWMLFIFLATRRRQILAYLGEDLGYDVAGHVWTTL
jgi:hypothetical protein